MLTRKSMTIDGVYLESLIEGYTTIDISGRETLASSLSTTSVSNRDGDIYSGKTYGPRTLAVSFVIEGDSYESIYEKIDILNEQLTVEHVQVSFNDEFDRFYNVSAFSGVSIGVSEYVSSDIVIAQGSFDAHCSDPFKYSKDLYLESPEIVIETDENDNEYSYPVFAINYDGNYKSYPVLEARFYDQNKSWDANVETDSMIEDYYRVAYDPIEVTSAEDFPEGSVYILEPREATVFSTAVMYYTLEEDTGSYVLTDISETDMLEEDHEPYYTLNPIKTDMYESETEYYLLNTQHIIPEIEDINEDVASPQEGDSGLANEDGTNYGACGFVGFVDDDGHILQFGNPEANEYNQVDVNPQLVNSTFNTLSSYSDKVKATWLTNAIAPPFGSRSNSGSFLERLRRKETYAKLTKSQVLYNAKKNGISYKIVVDKIDTRKADSCKVYYHISATLKSKTIKKNTNSVVISISFDNGNSWTSHTLLPKSKKKSWSKGKSKTVGSAKSPKSKVVGNLDITTQSLKTKIKVDVSGNRSSSLKFSATKANAISIPVYASMPSTAYHLSPAYGATSTGWHGPVLSRLLPADDNGSFGSDGFKMEVKGKFCIGDGVNFNLQKGILGVYVLGGDFQGGTLRNPTLLCGFEIRKTGTSSSDAAIADVSNHSDIGSEETVSNCIKYDNTSRFTISLEKSPGSNQIRRTYKNVNPSTGDCTKTYFMDTNVAGMKAYMIAIGFFAKNDSTTAHPTMEWAGIDTVKFTKYNVDAEAVNPFNAADVLTVDCKACTVELNGSNALHLSALGNDWDDFCLTPGLNQISPVYSEYTKNMKTYRKCRSTDTFDENINYYTYDETSGTYSLAEPTLDEFNASIVEDRAYYVFESCEPEFLIKYREVFI